MSRGCTNDWHGRNSYCPSCGETLDGSTTLASSPLGLILSGSIYRHRKTGVEKDFDTEEVIKMTPDEMYQWVLIIPVGS